MRHCVTAIPAAPMTETVAVQFSVARTIAIAGKGRLAQLATVELVIADVGLVLEGVQVVRDAGRLIVRMPQFRHPTTGQWHPAVVLPVELEDAIAAEVLGGVPGARLRFVTRSEDE